MSVTSRLAGSHPAFETCPPLRSVRRVARVHSFQNFRRRRIRATRIEGRLGRVLQTKLHHFGYSLAAQFGDEGQNEIDACCDAAPGQNIAVPDDAAVVDDGTEERQQFSPRPMASRPAAYKEAGSSEDERARAYRRQIASGRPQPDDLVQVELVFDSSEATTAAWHQKDVTGLDGGKVLQVREGETVCRDRLAAQRSHSNIQVGRAREELVRTGEVELGHAVVHRHYHADWLCHRSSS